MVQIPGFYQANGFVQINPLHLHRKKKKNSPENRIKMQLFAIHQNKKKKESLLNPVHSFVHCQLFSFVTYPIAHI